MKRKLLLVSLALALLSGIRISQMNAYAQSTGKTISVDAALKKITQSKGTQFVYDPELLQGKTTSYDIDNVKKAPLEEVLKGILYPHDLLFLYVKTNYYTIVPKDRVGDALSTNVVTPKTAEPPTQEEKQSLTTIMGKVVSDNEQSLSGATINIKGTEATTQSGTDGSFTLTSNQANPILLVSFVGFNDQEIMVNGTGYITVNMVAKANSLEQVVVVGYGTQKKTDVTGAVMSANLEDFRNSPNTNIAQSLQGTVPGLNIGQVTSAGSTPSISIRGNNTISGNSNVLIVLDGVQYNGSLESINPDDIANIDVLKDASSTAVYGAQAANGVLLITTRKGRKGQAPRVSFSTSYSTQNPTVKLRPMKRDAYLDHVRQLYYEQAYLAPGFTQPNPDFDLAGKLDETMTDVDGNIVATHFDWWDEATDGGFINDNQLSISGGTDRVSYLFSGGLTNQSGFIINDKFKRKSLRLNLDIQATKWWKIGIQTFGSFVNKDGAEPNISTIIQQSPLIEPFDENGDLKPFPFNTNFGNPFLTYYVDDYERNNYLFANIYSDMDIPFIKGLNYRINFGNNYRTNQRYQSSIYGASQSGSASKDFRMYYDYTFDNILTYKRSFAQHDITTTLLYGAIERQSDYTLANATAFSRLTLGYNSLEQGTNQFTNSDAWKEALSYQMARVNYKLADKYLLTATVRRDGFSGFAANNKFATFPSVALGWIMTEESFLNKVTWLDFLKFRAGYGLSGNQTSRYFSLSRVSTGPVYVFGDGGSTLFGQQIQSLANQNLSWEKTAGLNLGFDFRFLNGRLSGSLDYYNNTTNDLLYSVNIPSVTGFNDINTNLGQLRNQGVELALLSRNIDNKQFRWNSTLSFARNVNKIIRLTGLDADGDGKEDDLIASGLFIGKSINTVYGYVTDGIYQVGETIPTGYSAGNYRIVDVNKDGAITVDDRQILGRNEPAYRISLLNTFEYKGFTLSIFLNSIQGGKDGYLGNNSPSIFRDDNAIRYNYLDGIDYWSPVNPNGKYPQSIVSAAVNPAVFQSRSFIRLQDVSLSYRFQGPWVKRMKVSNLNLFVSGKNLATWTSWEGWDPETNQGLTINGRPVMKGVSAGLNLTF